MTSDRNAESGFCAQASSSDYHWSPQEGATTQDITYQNIKCAYLCSDNALPGGDEGSSCLLEPETTWRTPSGIFVPTFYSDIYADNFSSSATTPRNFFVPGVDNITLSWSYKYFSNLPKDYILGERTEIKGEPSSNNGVPIKTVFLNHSGTIMRTFNKGEKLEVSIKEMLEGARTEEFSFSSARIRLDDHYNLFEEGVQQVSTENGQQGPQVRLTGVRLTVNVHISNQGYCQMDQSTERQNVDMGDDGVVACISVRAVRGWVRKPRSAVLDDNGMSFTRMYHGMQISFEVGGELSVFDSFALLESLTIVFIWLQVPIFAIYLIAGFGLGTLSRVYSSAVHQDASMIDSATGIAGRLLTNSGTFNDLADTKAGVTKEQMLRRFNYILAFEEDLDANEQEKFVDFIYRTVLAVGADERPPPACDMASFCMACASGEALSFEVLQKFLDRSRSVGMMEKCFQDPSIAAIRSLSDAQLEQRMNSAEGGGGPGEAKSILRDLLAENEALQQSCKDMTQSLEESLQVAAKLKDQEDTRVEIAKAEVKSVGVAKKLPPQTLADGTVYDGEWVGGVRHGRGTMIKPDGSIYEGQFEFGEVHGFASYTLSQGAKYEGQWRAGKQDGNGKEVSTEGAIYEGQFKEGKKRGRAAIFFPDGSQYMGEVMDGKLCGHGKYMFSNGHVYEGQFDNDVMQGDAVYTWPDGIQYVGQYKENKKHGAGVLYWPDGRKFDGQYVNNQRHGKGIITEADGTEIEDEWIEGKRVSMGDQ
eukprot:TRINITY_DN17548_c0_g2_i1.p1 TRINITY_DN17548_c0_g2~~TRINITY_DN17548_c0_g2_i1.p1  ORF type:complete len:848 (+),score=197.24 TRINITY_DN17548_c0_g2_i1:270-2546(+)